jgi:hypothetical protein
VGVAAQIAPTNGGSTLTGSSPLYVQALGQQFTGLDTAVQQFHSLAGRHSLHGFVETEGARSLTGKVLALLLGAPRRHSAGPLAFELDADANAERWTRRFPHRVMSSTLRPFPLGIVEQLGAARLGFELDVTGGKLVMRLRRLWFWGIRCPACLMPRVTAEETGLAHTLYFNVRAEVPGIGLVVAYRGHLVLPAKEVA